VTRCPFCSPEVDGQVVLENTACVMIWTGGTPEGSAMVLPRAHRPTVFDLTPAEWVATRDLLDQARELIAGQLSPDGWNVGWNVFPVGGQSIPHAHCHLVPRYGDEPLAGRGIRWWIKDPSNRRHRPL
jgi:diadenosine tetraphosphate (Ap4A) HIT family hydrolase